ncbi:MAG: trypsin-like peptidase domain-containing protein [Caulobacteraceae bacterium]
MKRHPLYSNSGWSKPIGGAGRNVPRGRVEEPAAPPEPTLRQRFSKLWRYAFTRFEKPLLVAGAGLTALAVVVGYNVLQPKARVFTQADIDAAVAYTMKKHPEASHAAVAAEAVRPSVVRVTGYDPSKPPKTPTENGVASTPDGKPQDDTASSVGSGVVIDEKGSILTNLHVAASAHTLRVTFYNGLVSDAEIVSAQPEDDLAVIRAKQIPDDLKPATLVSTKNLRPGDEVVAVGFPFGIGPSVSSGVVSGLKREWVFDKDHRRRNMIQFDAAANPGNSGGPLVNRNGEVLGIVTGILNPNKQGVFIGIGFAVPIENAAKAVGTSPF